MILNFHFSEKRSCSESFKWDLVSLNLGKAFEIVSEYDSLSLIISTDLMAIELRLSSFVSSEVLLDSSFCLFESSKFTMELLFEISYLILKVFFLMSTLV